MNDTVPRPAKLDPATRPHHPPPEQLSAFGLGRLSCTSARAVASHLVSCESCVFRLNDLPRDPFVVALRRAHTATVVATGDTTDPDFTDAPPAVLAGHPRYSLDGLIGQGGMGAVYRAKHALMERTVALKVIAPKYLKNPEAAARFRQEVKAAARLHHPNIVTAFDAEEVGPLTVLVMEYVDGLNLADYLKERGPLPVEEACGYAIQAAHGLAHAHVAGLVHRDVKPHNLMLAPDGRVKILDFGLARLTSAVSNETTTADPADDALTRTGRCMGTPDYMAPEQAGNATAADAQSDIYSLGATMYHMLTGRVPFAGESVSEKLHHLAFTDPTPLEALRPDLPAGLVRVVGRMMAKHPADRFPTAEAVAAALAPFASPPRSRKKRRLLVGAGLLFALAALVAGVVVKFSTPQGEVMIETTDDPDVEVVVKGGKIVTIRDGKTGKEYVLDRTDLTLSMADGDGFQVTLDGTKPFVIRRSGKQLAVVRLNPPNAVRATEIFRTRWEGTDHICGFEFSPDGMDLYVGRGTDGAGRIYDLNAKSVRVELPQAWVGGYLPGGRELLISQGHNSMAVVDGRTGKVQREVARHPEKVASLQLAPDGKTVMTYSEKVVCRLWDVATGKLLKSWEGRSVFYSPEPGELLVTREINAPEAMWDVTAGTEKPVPAAYSRVVGLSNDQSERFGKDRIGTHLGQTLHIHDRATGKILHTLDMGRTMDRTKHRAIGVGPGGRFVVHTADGHAAVVRDVATGRELAHLPLGNAVAYKCVVSADGKRVAVTNPLGDIAVWELSE